jgi:hypothetical protein
MTVFEHLCMPSLGGANEWLNSEPLGPAELRGHVVVVDFWTLTCLNWLRQEPYVRAWSRAYIWWPRPGNGQNAGVSASRLREMRHRGPAQTLVGPVGLEPTTYGLKVRSSTN